MITQANKVDDATMKTYQGIDGLKVMEEYLFFKGIDGLRQTIPAKELESMAIIVYGLKFNATNKLYVATYLNKCYRRMGLVCDSGKIKIPSEIIEKVKIRG